MTRGITAGSIVFQEVPIFLKYIGGLGVQKALNSAPKIALIYNLVFIIEFRNLVAVKKIYFG